LPFGSFFSKFITLSQSWENPCARLLNLHTLEFLYQSFPHLSSPCAMIFQGDIYKVLLGLFMGSNIDWWNVSSMIKIKRFWSTFHNCELYTYAGFSMVILQQTWFLEVLVVFQTWKPMNLFLTLILRETWSAFDKNPLIRLEVWTHEKN